MLALLGWLVGILVLIWCTVAVFFITVPTFGTALFTCKWRSKLLAVILWIALISAWVIWFSLIEVKVNS